MPQASRLLFVAALIIWPASLASQQSRFGVELAGQAVAAWTRVDRVPGGTDLEETRVVQPVIMVRAHAFGGRLGFHGTLNLEGWTMPEGELAVGAFGEGFVDRRHPHTYFHELMLTGSDLLGEMDGDLRLSLSAGKGFVAFGTDDPMSRPVLRYPVNHHFSQILERYAGIAGVAFGPVALEATIFNGDEPEKPDQWPLWDRIGDSHAWRLTLTPVGGLELQGSTALVHSPEHRPGAGLDVRKKSLSARWQKPVAGIPLYAMAEWAESSEADRFFVFDSYLVELEASPGRHRAYYRAERTERPEEPRTTFRFRTVRPHLENSIIGITMWNLHTLGYGARVGGLIGRLELEPFGEVTYATVSRVGQGLFRPGNHYGGDTFWSFTAGLRFDYGMRGHRMGRYGVAADRHLPMQHESH